MTIKIPIPSFVATLPWWVICIMLAIIVWPTICWLVTGYMLRGEHWEKCDDKVTFWFFSPFIIPVIGLFFAIVFSAWIPAHFLSCGMIRAPWHAGFGAAAVVNPPLPPQPVQLPIVEAPKQ